jgi:hypothetical protein
VHLPDRRRESRIGEAAQQAGWGVLLAVELTPAPTRASTSNAKSANPSSAAEAGVDAVRVAAKPAAISHPLMMTTFPRGGPDDATLPSSHAWSMKERDPEPAPHPDDLELCGREGATGYLLGEGDDVGPGSLMIFDPGAGQFGERGGSGDHRRPGR